MKIVAKLKRKSLRALRKSGHHSVPGKNQEVPGVVHSARLRAVCQHSPFGRVSDPDDLVRSVSTIPNSELGIIVRRTMRNFNARVQFHAVSPP